MALTATRKGGTALTAARKGGTVLALHRPTSPLDDATLKEIALEFVSTAENATKNYTTAYAYIEDIGDGRGYTGGIVGWCSGTGDMLVLVQRYQTLAPGNVLAKYIAALQQIMTFPYAERPAQSHTLLDPGFTTDWATAGADPLFQQAQQDERDRVYWNPALAQAKADGLTQLGLAIYYDISVNHGPGNDSQSFGGIVAGVKSAGTKAPAQGGDEKTFLTAIVDARDAVLQSWGDYQANGRSSIHRKFLADNNLPLTLPLTWSVYGDTYSITTAPTTPGGVTPPTPPAQGGGLAFTAGTPYSSTASEASTSVTIALPAATTGDYLMLVVSLNVTSAAITGPAGWATAFASASSTASTSHAVAVSYKQWTAGDPASATFTTNSAGRVTAIPFKVSGADASTFLDVATVSTSQAAATTAIDAPSTTPTAAANPVLLVVASGRSATSGATFTFGAPTGMTLLAQGCATSTGTNAGAAVFTQTVSPGTATGTRTSSASGTLTGSRGIALVVRAAAATTPPATGVRVPSSTLTTSPTLTTGA